MEVPSLLEEIRAISKRLDVIEQKMEIFDERIRMHETLMEKFIDKLTASL
jgi:tetrahydromethanopterin S-methyltransferase subunit G